MIFYIMGFLLGHCLTPIIYFLPWYKYGDIDTTLKGFHVATYGVISFCIGNVILAPYFMRLFNIRLSNYSITQLPNFPNNNYPMTQLLNHAKNRIHSNLPKLYLVIGIISYFLMFSIVGRLPTLNALVSVGQQLILIGIFLACWKAWSKKNNKKLFVYLILSLSFPFITIIHQGFFGAGMSMTMMIYLFTLKFFRPRWKAVTAFLLLIYLGLTFYQSYMRDRKELRDTIWGGAPIIERVEELGTTLSNAEWFNPFDVEQLKRVDDRMNQNFLVGKAVDYLGKTKDYAYGETLWESMIALVPRIIWRDKPVYAGSGDMVSKYTGLIFTPGTSVGVGQVMEFYINFGIPCVIIGFLVLGIIIAIIDLMAGYHLVRGNWQKFALWILPGLAFLNLGGSLVEVTSSAGAGLVVAYLASRLRSSHYPVLLAIIYLSFVGYIANRYIFPELRPYLEILIPIALLALLLRKIIKSIGNRVTH